MSVIPFSVNVTASEQSPVSAEGNEYYDYDNYVAEYN